MKLLDKIKDAIFEDDEFEEIEEEKHEEKIETPRKEVKVRPEPVKETLKEEVVKQVDIEKTLPKRIEIPKEDEARERVIPKREHRKTPVIFDEEDFVLEDLEQQVPKREPVKKEEPKKPLYGGYKEDKAKEKFKPSPVISPVYGFVGVSPILEQPRNDELSSFNEMFAKEKKEEVTLDDVRQKAYGIESQTTEDDDLGLLYDMQQDEAPAISKITLGDAEEYFDDLGLEYNVDYKDTSKEKSSSTKKTTRENKNKELIAEVESKIETQKKILNQKLLRK